jgi:hypothetical protein
MVRSGAAKPGRVSNHAQRRCKAILAPPHNPAHLNPPQPNGQPSWLGWQAVRTSWRKAPRRLPMPANPVGGTFDRVGEHRVAGIRGHPGRSRSKRRAEKRSAFRH